MLFLLLMNGACVSLCVSVICSRSDISWFGEEFILYFGVFSHVKDDTQQ